MRNKLRILSEHSIVGTFRRDPLVQTSWARPRSIQGGPKSKPLRTKW